MLAKFANLKAVIALSAGVDHLLADPKLPSVPIARVVHPDLTMRMVEYIVLHVLMHHRQQRRYDAQQRERVWKLHEQPPASEVAVGIMGLGAIGMAAGKVLADIGFKVAGWSQKQKHVNGIESFHGEGALDALPQPHGNPRLRVAGNGGDRRNSQPAPVPPAQAGRRVSAEHFSSMPRAANCRSMPIFLRRWRRARLAGATLDVFPQEPLPASSPLWTHPQVTITPHNAGDISPRLLAREVIEQIERLERGDRLHHLVDRRLGY